MRISDWSSDVCSSDLWERLQPAGQLCDLFGCGSIYSFAVVASMLVKIGEMLLLAFGERPHARCSRRGAAQDRDVFELKWDSGPRSVLELALHKSGIKSCLDVGSQRDNSRISYSPGREVVGPD